MCHEGFVHSDFVDSKFSDVVQPAAVFYFAFDGTSTGPGDNLTGTAFYREVETGIERVKDVRDWSDDLPSSAFQRTHTVIARPNRMALYSQDLLHNAFVRPGTSLPCSPSEGRLAISLFFLMLDGAREISAAAPWRQRATSILSGASRACHLLQLMNPKNVSSWTPYVITR